MTSQTAPAIIHKLVETFEQNLDSYRSSKNETELRREFLDKFFTALGWDVANEKGYDELGKEVIHEFSVDVAGQQKKADYAFRVGRGDKFDFLVEAKKPSVKIESSPEAAFQIRRYGWSAKLPINILSDFEHFAVYDCRTKPSYNDKASMGRIMLIHYKDYVSRWNEIVEIFSPEAVRKGSLAKYAESMKGKKGTADVDDAFLQEIERWRELLAKNIALRNDDIDIAGLNYSVQMTIDRIVFLRICEERGIEPENQLLEIVNRDGVYTELCELFKRADTKYNSGLFHFKQEKEQGSRPDDLTLSLDIDDKVLKDIISNLYYPKSPYAFLYIPSDILGQVYERFLGKVIRLTDGHQAKVDDKPEVRKAGGVFYTPTYIVEYIVKNTVGKLVESKSPKDVASLKIVDPACGSGTFLLGAYQFLLDWHLNWYVENEPEKAEKSKAIIKVNDSYRLTTVKKKEILLNNIYGVDIDAQAVEVTKLSLLLKVLENASGQLGLGMERVLPDLGNNIKCGNSLIGYDFFDGQMFPDKDEQARVNPFNWKNEFKEVFAKNGFDVVIGNPPYIRTLLLEESKEYFKKAYKSAMGAYDIYVLFLEKALEITRHGGMTGFITPNKYFVADYASKIREDLLTNARLISIADLGKCKSVFEGALISTAITVYSKEKPSDKIDIKILSDETVRNIENVPFNTVPTDQIVTPEQMIQVYADVETNSVLSKLHKVSESLSSVADVRTGVMGFDYWAMDKFISDKNKGIRIATNSYIERYSFLWGKKVNLYKRTVFDPKLDPKCDILSDNTMNLFKSKKIVVRGVARRLTAMKDDDGVGMLVAVHSVIGKKYSDSFLLGLLNSKLFNWIHVTQFYSARIPEGSLRYPISFLSGLPIKKVDFEKENEKSIHDRIVMLVEKMLALHKDFAQAKSPQEKDRMERQIADTDNEIDLQVYKLYGLNDKEIKIVEGSL